MKLCFKTFQRTLEIDFGTNTYKDKSYGKDNKGKGYIIISKITYWEIKDLLRKRKFKKDRGNLWNTNIK